MKTDITKWSKIASKFISVCNGTAAWLITAKIYDGWWIIEMMVFISLFTTAQFIKDLSYKLYYNEES